MHFRSILTRCYSFSNGSRYWRHQAKCQTQSSRKEASKVEQIKILCAAKNENRATVVVKELTYMHRKNARRQKWSLHAKPEMWDNHGNSPLHWRGNVWKGLEQPGLFPNLPVQCPDQWFHPCWWLRCLWWLREMKGIVCRYDGKVRLAGERYCGWQGGHLGNAMCFPGTREWRREICNTRPPCNTAIL